MRLLGVALSALSGVVLAASSALAADIAAIPPPPLWGFYFGGGGCYDWANFDAEKTKTETYKVWTYHGYTTRTRSHTKNFEGDASAWCGTVQVGYDYQIDPLWIIGFFGSYDWQKKEGDLFKVYRNGDLSNHPYGSVFLGDIATVGGRAGLLVQPDLMVYALLGYSWSNGGIELYHKTLGGNLSGPTIGGGIEKLFATHWSARFEYRFTDFGSLSTSSSWGNHWYSVTKTKTVSITDQSLRLVVSYRP